MLFQLDFTLLRPILNGKNVYKTFGCNNSAVNDQMMG